jgi:uncharacterized metal-binding protein YceD (DUF177 family)
MLDIDLKALPEDSNEFTLVLDDSYFKALDDAEIQHGTVTVTVLLRKMPSDQFALSFSIEGSVTIPCDLCLDDMEQPVKGQCSYIVKLGTESGVDDEVIVVDENQGILSLPWIIYETIVLAIPIKHVHAPGKCNAAMTEKLEELSATRSGDEETNISDDNAIDPRWAALKKFKD